jgi:dissimilatory sulfite reductase (desulfoviridin) alpha/beta subunit
MSGKEIDYEDLKKRGFLRQKQEGFFVLRTRMAFGAYDVKALAGIIDVAGKYAKGIVHATTRQGLEIPFIKFEDITNVEKELAASSVLTGTSGARVRTTTACPGNNWCKRGLVDTFRLEKRITDEAGVRCGSDLPHKLKIAISGCPNGCTRPQFTDIGIHSQIDASSADKRTGYALYIGGCGGRNPKEGHRLGKLFTEDEVVSLVGKIVKFYRDKGKPRQRLSFLIEEFGKENFYCDLGYFNG